jgi:hypothetical protein
MKYLLLIVTLGSALAPGAILAQGCNHGRDQQAQISCSDGEVWDQKVLACVSVSS